MPLAFEWDPEKARRNLKKHKVAFEEASTVFADPLARIVPDPAHSNGEAREIIIDSSALDRLLFVSFAERAGGRIRLISARPATRNETKDYADNS